MPKKLSLSLLTILVTVFSNYSISLASTIVEAPTDKYDDKFFTVKSYTIQEIEEKKENTDWDIKQSSFAPYKITHRSLDSYKNVKTFQQIPVLPNPGKKIVNPNLPSDDDSDPYNEDYNNGNYNYGNGYYNSNSKAENVIMVIDHLIAVGEKVINIIKEGRSVVNNNPMAAISVLPRSDEKDPVVHDMGGWTIPVSKHYNISFKNGYGAEMVSFVYSVSFQYNGSTKGKGKYLAGVRASARRITTHWGYDLDANSQLIQISNVGTQQNVIAGATLELNLTVKTWLKTIFLSESFHVTGAGKIYKLD